MSKQQHSSRRNSFYQNMQAGEAVILFAGTAPRKSADATYPFFANRNFYYLTGITQTQSVFLAVHKGDKVEETLFISPKNPLAERWNGYRISTQEATEFSGIEVVKLVDDFAATIDGLLDSGVITALWYDFDRFDEGLADAPQNLHAEMIRTTRAEIATKNAYPFICAARTIKDEGEIAEIREAMKVTRDGIHAMMKSAKPGMREYQLEAVFMKVLGDAGVRESAFSNIVSSGRNNFYIHYEDPVGTLHDGDLILTDVGARKNEYVSDISRAFPVNGKFTDQQKEVYSIALKVNKELMGLLVPGETSFEQIEEYSRRRVG